jgi:hypothetical protein
MLDLEAGCPNADDLPVSCCGHLRRFRAALVPFQDLSRQRKRMLEGTVFPRPSTCGESVRRLEIAIKGHRRNPHGPWRLDQHRS